MHEFLNLRDVGLLAEGGKSLLERLDPITRSKVLSVLVILLIVLFAVMGLAWLSFRFIRRYMSAKDSESTLAGEAHGKAASADSPWNDEDGSESGPPPASKG